MATWLAADLPQWADPPKSKPIDFYYWHWGTLGLLRFEGPKGARWKAWNDALKTALVDHQRVKKDGCVEGSWDPEADRFFWAGGRPAATAINVLTLGAYCR